MQSAQRTHDALHKPTSSAAREPAFLHPPLMPPRSRTLSGRPSCRIYRGPRAWMLEFETASGGWMEPWEARRRPKKLAFPTLAEAIGYAEWHGYDYRIEPHCGAQSLPCADGVANGNCPDPGCAD